MKLFAGIIAFYIFWLAVTPCSQDGCADDHAQHSIVAHDDGHRDCSDDAAGCKPFCLDKCCAPILHFPRIAIAFTCPTLVATPHHDRYAEQYINTNYAIIWQPPKVC